MRVPDALRPVFEIWTHRNYACFMGGMSPSLVTLWMQRIGMLWLAWELTHSNTWVGIVVAIDYAPMIILAPFVGAHTDRSDPVLQQKITQWIKLAFSALMAFLTAAGLMNIWLLVVLSLFLGCLQPFDAISRHSIVPRTVPLANLPTALATDSAIFNAARFIGPALAGFLIYAYGVSSTFSAHCVGCVFYLAGLYAMRLPPPENRGHAHAGMLDAITAGLQYVRNHAGIGPMFLLMAIGAVWIRPLQDLLPGFADRVFEAGPQGLGWLTASMGVGATIAAGFVAFYGRTSGLTLVVLLAFLANMVSTILFAATHWMWLAVIFGALWGGSLTMLTTAAQALVQSSVDDAVRGRVMALYTMIYRGAPFLGALIIGWLGDRIGLQPAFVAAAVLCVIPWIITFAKRHSMTLALEGRGNDLDERLFAASKAAAGVAYEQMVDLKTRAGPMASKVAEQARTLAAKAREVKLAERWKQRSGRDDLK